MDVGGPLAQGFADDLVDKFFDRGLLRLVLVEHIDLLGPPEVDILLHSAPLEQFLEGLGADAVDLPESREDALAGVKLVTHPLRHSLGHSLAREEVEGVVGQKGQLVALGDNGQQLIAQGDARRQFCPQLRRRPGDIGPAPREVKLLRQLAVEPGFVNLGAVEQRAHERGLAAGGVLERRGHFFPVARPMTHGQVH